jgi:hypothetical protein
MKHITETNKMLGVRGKNLAPLFYILEKENG